MTTNKDPYVSGDIKIVSGDEPRSLDELLKMETYQGMTDDELRLLFAYKEQIAYKSGLNAGRDIAVQQEYASYMDASLQKMLDASRAYESAISSVPVLKEVDA